jgi:LuxR family maltose regulon positive regulatory protein
VIRDITPPAPSPPRLGGFGVWGGDYSRDVSRAPGEGDRHSEREGTLLSCSFAPPGSTGDIVSRPRLLRRLHDAVRAPLTIVSGEPASGKTTLAVDWLRSGGGDDRSVAWLTLPHRLDDELLFWQYLLAALDPFGLHVDDLEDQLADGNPPDDRWLNVLSSRLGSVAGESLVVLDDLHELDNRDATETLRKFVERVPANVHLLFLTRSKPPWPLSEWRMSGRIDEIDSIEIRFTLDEVRHLVASTPGLDLTDDATSQLFERTEGWAGGVKMALLSMRRTSDPAEVVARFAADDELISSYLFRGVLAQQDPEVSEFLLDISVLDLITPEICDAIRDRTDGSELLERCRSENLFLVELPGTRRYFRLHGLFAQLLRATLETGDPDRADRLHLRASEVFEERRDVRAAIAHAVAAHDDARTGRLIAWHAGGHASRGEWDEVSSWLPLLRTKATTRNPEIAMALAITLGLTGGGEEALEILDRLSDQFGSGRMGYAAEQLRGLVLTAKGEVDSLAEIAAKLREPVPEGEFTLPFDETRLADYLAGVAAVLDGDLTAARTACERATARRERPSLFYVESPGWLARVAYEEGKLSEATRFAHESLTRHTEIRSGETAVSVPAQLTLADVAWERNELEECERHLALADRTVRPLFWERVLIEGSHSRLRASRGMLTEARRGLQEVGKLYLAGTSAPQLRAVVSRCAVDLALRADDVSEALTWARAFESCGRGLLPAALRVRMAAATGVPDLDSQVAEALSTHEETPSRISTLLAVAEVVSLDGDDRRARALVARAAALAEPEGFVRRFCDAGPETTRILPGLLEDWPTMPGTDPEATPFFLGVLTEALAQRTRRATHQSPDQRELLDPLTDRELEVLDLLVGGRSYTEIGAELFVSRNTVKSHVRHVYTKLGVTSRSAAAAEAQRLGLV